MTTRWKLSGAAAGLSDGPIRWRSARTTSCRSRPSGNTCRLEGHVQVTELSGSESSAHFDMDGQSWVSLSPGVHPYFVGEVHTFYLDPNHCFFFGPSGELAA
jgi:glycerol transport system ATP-binding protein